MDPFTNTHKSIVTAMLAIPTGFIQQIDYILEVNFILNEKCSKKKNVEYFEYEKSSVKRKKYVYLNQLIDRKMYIVQVLNQIDYYVECS